MYPLKGRNTKTLVRFVQALRAVLKPIGTEAECSAWGFKMEPSTPNITSEGHQTLKTDSDVASGRGWVGNLPDDSTPSRLPGTPLSVTNPDTAAPGFDDGHADPIFLEQSILSAPIHERENPLQFQIHAFGISCFPHHFSANFSLYIIYI